MISYYFLNFGLNFVIQPFEGLVLSPVLFAIIVKNSLKIHILSNSSILLTMFTKS